MFTVPVPKEVVEYGIKQAQYDWSCHPEAGHIEDNKVAAGVIGETMICDMYKKPRPNGATGPDGGKDIVVGLCKIDVKTMKRSVEPRITYNNNFPDFLMPGPANVILFCSLKWPNECLRRVESALKQQFTFTVCGWSVKADIKNYGKFYKKGEKVYRADGSFFLAHYDQWDIMNYQLIQIESEEDMKDQFKELSKRWEDHPSYMDIDLREGYGERPNNEKVPA